MRFSILIKILGRQLYLERYPNNPYIHPCTDRDGGETFFYLGRMRAIWTPPKAMKERDNAADKGATPILESTRTATQCGPGDAATTCVNFHLHCHPRGLHDKEHLGRTGCGCIDYEPQREGTREDAPQR